ncbi:MAG: endonuclease III domain-containing protein [Syntrophomonas sp.]
MEKLGIKVMQIYDSLLSHFGPRGWWPGDSRLEIILGAVLTQAVAWKNVEKAIKNLKQANLLSIPKLLNMDEEELAEFIRPALYHRQKARKINKMLVFIHENYKGDLDLMLSQPTNSLREKLLTLWGIGPETADSILLYAGNHKIFVVDAYTKRVFTRLDMVDEDVAYNEMQVFMHRYVAPQTQIYNEYHALLVALGANYCLKSKPRCPECPLNDKCKYFKTLQEKNWRR